MAIINDQNQNNDKNAEIERANRNNANNIRNAADVAIASKNPYAMAAGGLVKGLDKATGGKSTDAFGKLATRAGQITPQGRKIQNLSNKLSESGASDKIGKAASLKNGMKSGDSAAEKKLQKSKANKTQNLLNQRNKNNSNSDNDSHSESEQNNESNDENNQSVLNVEEDSPVVKRIKIKIIIFSSIILLVILIVLAIFLAIFGVDFSQSVPLVGPMSFDHDGFQSMYEEGTHEYENEMKYYKELRAIKERYDSSHSDELKVNYIHAVLIYIYSQTELEDYSDEEEKIPIDYAKMTSLANVVYSIMETGKDNTIDYEKNGEFYNALKESSWFNSYYESALKKRSVESILDEIFDLAEALEGIEVIDETTITSETGVTNTTSGSNPMSINDYLAGSIYASTNNISNGENVKAYTVAYSTNIVANNKSLSVNNLNASASNPVCDVKLGCSYDENGNLVSGGEKQSSRNTYFYNGAYYYKLPLSSEEQSNLNKSINSVFGTVLVKDNGTYPNLNISKLDGFGDGDYKIILKQAYGDYKFKNVGENNYILDGSYGDKKVLTQVTFYDQKDYSDYKFCGIKKYTIGGSGCGVTAMAIVASTYEKNDKYDPIYMNDEARKRGLCSNSGTSQAFFSKEASVMKYKYWGGTKYNKSLLNAVLRNLSQGHLVVVRMGSGHFTSGGHYMVLGGVDPETKKVYVYDPNNRSNKQNRKTGNGWYSFNDIIVKEAYNFYIIWKG